MSETGHDMQNLFLRIFLLIYSTTVCDQVVVKTKFKGLKRKFSSQITEKWLNDVSKWR